MQGPDSEKAPKVLNRPTSSLSAAISNQRMQPIKSELPQAKELHKTPKPDSEEEKEMEVSTTTDKASTAPKASSLSKAAATTQKPVQSHTPRSSLSAAVTRKDHEFSASKDTSHPHDTKSHCPSNTGEQEMITKAPLPLLAAASSNSTCTATEKAKSSLAGSSLKTANQGKGSISVDEKVQAATQNSLSAAATNLSEHVTSSSNKSSFAAASFSNTNKSSLQSAKHQYPTKEAMQPSSSLSTASQKHSTTPNNTVLNVTKTASQAPKQTYSSTLTAASTLSLAAAKPPATATSKSSLSQANQGKINKQENQRLGETSKQPSSSLLAAASKTSSCVKTNRNDNKSLAQVPSTSLQNEMKNQAQGSKQTYSSLLATSAKSSMSTAKEPAPISRWPSKKNPPTKISDGRVSSLMKSMENDKASSPESSNLPKDTPSARASSKTTFQPKSYAAAMNTTVAPTKESSSLNSYAAALNKKSGNNSQHQHESPILSHNKASDTSHESSLTVRNSTDNKLKTLLGISEISTLEKLKPKPKKRWGDESDSDSD
jgi:hypothetical protein